MNKVILVGRLTRDPEVKYTPSGKMVATFTLAVDRAYTANKEQKETDFVPIVVWGNTAEFCGNYLNKGSKILVDGRLQVRSYEKDGQRRYVTEVIANSVDSLERRSSTGGPSNDNQQVKDSIASFGSDVDINDEVPF